ncbi:MAG: hypothetical protein AUG51_25660 [Acidobacteria bacterium 13_1_20CM_3_53_8]|nr:MAG: hypothetical protein AUG51_25660 [Acidobacteria bacterium 13_1_20CM_3_53_8]
MSTETRPGRPVSPHTTSTPDRPTGRLRQTSPHTTEIPGVAKSTEAAAGAIKFSASELNTAMVHFYRGEIQRSNTWRNRLDTTTNWAVITAGATLSFAFSAPGNPHFVILINSIVVAFFLFMEARRYRYYEIWASRVRVMESGYFAQMLGPQQTIDRVWAEHLMADLTTPHFTISESEALGRRLRRNYLWLFILLALSWNLKVYLHPQTARDMGEFIARAAVGVVPGSVVLLVGFIFNLGLIIFALATLRLREATGEVLPKHEFSLGTLGRVTGLSRVAATTRRSTRRAKQARQRLRGSTTGQFKRIDISETPDRQIHTTETPDRRPAREKTLT